MPMNPLPVLDEPFDLSASTKKLLRKLNEWCAQFNEKLAAYDASVDDLVRMDNAQLAAKLAEGDAEGDANRAKLQLLDEEFRIRTLMGQYFQTREKDWLKATDAMRTQHAECETRIREGLLKLGYVEGNVPGTHTLCMIPAFFHHHPEWSLLRQKLHAVQSANQSPHDAQNRERIDQIHRELTEVRDAILRKRRL